MDKALQALRKQKKKTRDIVCITLASVIETDLEIIEVDIIGYWL